MINKNNLKLFDPLINSKIFFKHICACEYIIERTQGLNEQLSIENTILRGEFKVFYFFF